MYYDAIIIYSSIGDASALRDLLELIHLDDKTMRNMISVMLDNKKYNCINLLEMSQSLKDETLIINAFLQRGEAFDILLIMGADPFSALRFAIDRDDVGTLLFILRRLRVDTTSLRIRANMNDSRECALYLNSL